MRWREGRRSENVEDRRGARMPMGGGGLSIGLGGVVVIVLVSWLLGADPLQVLATLGGGEGSVSVPVDPWDGGGEAPAQRTGGPEDAQADFVSVVLADTEDVWSELFATSGERYAPPRLVLFTDLVRSACGMAQSAMGPFYCPADQKVYIDLGF